MLYLMFAAGLAGLFLGGEFLVRGAVGIARGFRVPPFVIGLTVVGFGTSAPELLVSIQAALEGAPDLAIGNVIGSNIANILLILGLSALILPVPISMRESWRDFAVLVGATALFWALLLGGEIGRPQGALLIALLFGYLVLCLRGPRGAANTDAAPALPGWANLGLTLGGLAALMIGARLLVTSATELARDFGVSEAVIGLTIVAIGTSLPELATSVVSALRGHSEIAVGNILGSCIFNILCIVGLTALVAPIPVDPRFARLDMVVAAAATLAMIGLAARAGRTGRAAGAMLLAAYAAYLAVLT
ncbi:MAG: calcium/sodium antiporter [Rhodobacteraceae bacterium]|uniref:calcium/sodium antiporter n=1 Tax=Albidovulum sp. TaxID=1872424 RepID=UPI001DFCC037|nr:calcium/sodium antiporter [Paracoccaceae bacterium]MCB2110386.1 calcium/sodium antiporter [Paracoccaceae bacterium]MCC0064268.1 calcium/sodium antiporter [Defluviimonas sp.]